MIEQVIKQLSEADYKEPQTILDLINNNSILIEVIDNVINNKDSVNE